ncbi:heavy metal sensor histidine kinase [Oleiagrimonas sp. C23AA]|uniref:heavy metal sensor histidine kinase n=1 Tax=Oleiagrimonas sp. C23AA TaxID=2719047 RepID=UPI0031B72450
MRAWSITARMTVFYTVSALIAVGLLALLLNWKLTTSFQGAHVRYLQAKADEFQTDLNDAGGRPSALVAEIVKETGDSPLRPYEARVMLGDKVLGQTPGMQKVLPPALFPPIRHGPIQADQLRRKYTQGDHWVLASVAFDGVHGTNHAPHIELALNVSRDTSLLDDFHNALVIFFLCLVPLLVLLGRWIAGRALEPVRRIATYAGDVRPTDLSRRIPPSEPWPAELRGLVHGFNRMLDRLDDAFTRLTRFSADLAHELRTPLANLTGEIEVCLTRPRSPEAYRATLVSGLEECRLLTQLIENLLFLARAERAQLHLRSERFDVGDAVGWVVAQHEETAAAREIHIALSGTADLEADPMLFRQAVSNLLSNAIRHAPRGSSVEVRAGTDTAGAVAVSVIDHGEGIPVEALDRVFERFYQVDVNRRHQPGQGTGLGLSIVRSIMELHGGTAGILCDTDEGTVATLRFPRRRHNAAIQG